MDMRMTVGGDAKTGWLVDIHDGFKQGCYSPAADTPELAAVLALQTHAGIAGRPFEFPRPATKAEVKAAEKDGAKAADPTRPADALASAGIAANDRPPTKPAA
jgi:hypothetical protein